MAHKLCYFLAQLENPFPWESWIVILVSIAFLILGIWFVQSRGGVRCSPCDEPRYTETEVDLPQYEIIGD